MKWINKMKIIKLLIIMAMFGNIFSGKGQANQKHGDPVDRQPAVAGQFYPVTATGLRDELRSLFAKAGSSNDNEAGCLQAIITPHAGYVYSGQVAASAFMQIDPNHKYETIFLIGSSHRVAFDGASVNNTGDYITPLGRVKVDREIADQLIEGNPVFTFNPEAHHSEHSLEVQLPFLQYHLKTNYKIVPIIIASQKQGTIQKIAQVLKPYFNEKNLFIISSDFSHYPSYQDAIEIDQRTARAIEFNSPERFMEVLEQNRSEDIPGMATSMCGWSSMLAVLTLTSKMEGISIKALNYQNSGDADFGDKDRVVGYWAMAVYRQAPAADAFNLSDQDKKDLLQLARISLEKHLNKNASSKVDTASLSPVLHTMAGAFVSLHTDGQLRGCIGRFNPEIPLWELVQALAISAASEDLRFARIEADELARLDIEISVLSPMRKITSPDEIELGRHGIYLRQGMNSGTFLPQVAESTGWTREEFLGHCARDKAHIGWDGWRSAEMFTYEAIIFSESDFFTSPR